MILLAESADPAYQAGQAFGQMLFSIGLTIAIAYGVVLMVRHARRQRRDARAGVHNMPVAHVPQSGTAYASWGAQAPPAAGAAAPTSYASWGAQAPPAVGAAAPTGYDPTRPPGRPY
jgi:hypothetical protein